MNSFYAVFFIEQLRLKEKGKYYEYLLSFPLNITNYPELFSDEEMNMLQGSVDLLIAIKKRKNDNKLEYDALCQSESSFSSLISFREYQEGKILASLRAYDIVFTDGLTR